MMYANSLRQGQELLSATVWKDQERKDNSRKWNISGEKKVMYWILKYDNVRNQQYFKLALSLAVMQIQNKEGIGSSGLVFLKNINCLYTDHG